MQLFLRKICKIFEQILKILLKILKVLENFNIINTFCILIKYYKKMIKIKKFYYLGLYQVYSPNNWAKSQGRLDTPAIKIVNINFIIDLMRACAGRARPKKVGPLTLLIYMINCKGGACGSYICNRVFLILNPSQSIYSLLAFGRVIDTVD